ncbi:regulator of cytoskeleton and endocytosis Rvs161p [[Candida] anglica]|uniref:Regulator of cytoskeleton and endocytosis Rvs161p n=1 Tax=[Candida] anglica TaxID=148631 RepID=A0ABP0EL51_9ASCO
MSWNGIKKAINRAGTQVMMKVGQIDATVDLEFEFEKKRFRTMEEKSNKLQSELKHYLSTLRNLTTAQLNVSDVLSTFYGDGAEQSVSKEYHMVMEKLNKETLQELEQPYSQTVLNPIARFNSYYIEINEAIKKRNHKQLDYDTMKSKVQKLMDNPGTDEIYEKKLEESQRQLENTEVIYNNINSQLKQELPRLVNLRIPFLDPSFESFVKLQLKFFSDSYQELNGIQSKLDAQTRQEYIEGKLDNKIDDVLLKMRELNITGM